MKQLALAHLCAALLALVPADCLAQDQPEPAPSPDPPTQPARDTAAPEPAAAPMDAPKPDPAVAAALAAGFLRPEEAKDLRVNFGTATEADLDTPARKARWAIITGRYLDPSLNDPQAPLLDRAEALLRRGDPQQAITLIEKDESMRAVRIRAASYEDLGRLDMAATCTIPASSLLAEGKFTSATQVADAVRAVAIGLRLRVPIGAPGAEHKRLMEALKHAREQLDRLAWPVVLAEAELLQEKDNPGQAQQAILLALAMNPACAEAWVLLGRMAVDAFEMGSAEAIAARIDLLAGAVASAPPGEGNEPGAVPFDPAPASPLAAAIRIRAMLRQNDPDMAVQLSRGAAAAYPNHRRLGEALVAVAALRFDKKALDDSLAAYDRLAPGSGRGFYEAGRALSEARQYADASRLLKSASERMPNWPAPLIDLGLLSIQSADDAEAERSLSIACEMDPFNIRAANSLQLMREVATYERAESDHFIVRYKPGNPGDEHAADAAVAREMLPVLEDNHRRVTSSPEQVPGGLDYSPPRKTFIDLMPNHRWFAVRIAGMPRIHTIAASTGPIIAMETPREGQSHSGTYDWPRVLRHEYTHTVGLGKTSNRLPHWFTEAQAVYLEHSPRDEDTCRLLARTLEADELFDFVEINAAFVRPKKPTDRQLAYAQGHWMYQFMVETFGERAPLKLMDLYAQGVREEQAYQNVLGISRDEFMTRFKTWAREQATSWGLVPKPGQPPIKDLVIAELKNAKAPEGGDGAEAQADEPEEPGAELVAKLLEAHPDHPDVLELAIRQALSENNNTPTLAMLPLLERYATARPVAALPHRALARLYLNLPEPPPTEAGPSPRDAIPHLEWLDAREDKSPAFASQLGALYAVSGNLDIASDKAERATRIAPYDARYREKAAAIALQRNDPATAKRHIEAMISLEPDRPIHKQRLEAVNKRLPAR